MATVSLFWDTNMAAVTSCENTLYKCIDILWRGDPQWAHSSGHSGHSFVRNDFSHAEQESQKDKNRQWPSHFKLFKLQHKASKATHPTIFWKRHWKKVPMIAWETSILNGCTHTHTHTQLASYTHREICNHVLERKKIVKKFKLEQKMKKNPKRPSS